MSRNKNIKKRMELIENQAKKLSVTKEQTKCECNHTKDCEPDIVASNNRKEGELKYICRNCKKEIYLNKIPEETLATACDTVDRAIDIIKMSLDPRSEAQADMLKKMAKTQFRVRNEIGKLYASSLKKNSRGRSNRRNDYNDESGWTKPTTNGR